MNANKDETLDDEKQGEGGKPPFTIHVDRKRFIVDAESLTGAEIRALPDPPIGSDRDLYLVVPGPGADELIEDSREVELRNGMHFYSTPRHIDPGRGAAS